MNIKEKFIPEGTKCDTKQYFVGKNPVAITIHWVGPYPGQTPDIVRDYWIKSNGEASAHYIIKDNDVLQCWPCNKVAWHCGKGNSYSIGIEVIPMNTAGKFSDKSITTLKDLIKLIKSKYKISNIVRHYDWTKKECPAYYVDDTLWQDLLKKIS